MIPTKPILVERVKTIILEANETNSKSFGAGSYETILNSSVEINNGDTISLESAFVDTSNINPENIYIDKDVEVTWNNGSYVINQELENFCPSANLGQGQEITNNMPIIFSQYHVSSESDMVLWTTVTSVRFDVTGPSWGGVPIQFQVLNAQGKPVRVTVKPPVWYTQQGGNPEETWDLNIVGRRDGIPVAIDPETGDPVGPALYSFDRGNIPTGATGYIYTPIKLVDHYPHVDFQEFDTGRFTPVINEGHFTVPSGQYTPVHLAKILTDGFDRLKSDRFSIDPVPKNNIFPSRIDSFTTGGAADPTTTIITIPDIDFRSLPAGAWSLSVLEGWTASITYASVYEVIGPPIVDEVINNISTIIVASLPGDAAGTFRVPLMNPLAAAPYAVFPTVPGYVENGGPTVVFSPPVGTFDEGSAFLQNTENYKLRGVDGKPMFALVDATAAHRNIFTFNTDAAYVWTGSNNIEVIWDDEQKRFKFNYLHYPLTSGVNSGPAVINQVSFAFYEGVPSYGDLPNPLPAGYYRGYAYGSSNMSVKSYGGCFFTDLQPFNSFWHKILGFNQNIIVPYAQDTIQHSFATGIPTGGITSTDYTNVTLPRIDLTVSENITEQLFVLGDLTGKPLDYTGSTDAPFSRTAAPSVPDEGRVGVSADDTLPITAGQGEAVGVQSSGYYVADIDIGTSYNENIGSDTIQSSYSRNIRAIINRYYSANSYTSSAGNNISYIHYGNSFQLSNIKVRLTNSDGSAIKDLGTDNSIFLKVVKQQQINIAPDPMPPPPKN